MDVLVVGDANPDLILRGDVRPRFGQEEQLLTGADLVLRGSAATTPRGHARLARGGVGAAARSGPGRLGLATLVLGAVGEDVFGTVTRDQLAAHGVTLA